MATQQKNVAAGFSRDNAPTVAEGGRGCAGSRLLLDPRYVRGDARMAIAAIKQGRVPAEMIRLLSSRAAKIAAETDSVRTFVACLEILTASAARLEHLATKEPTG